MHYLLFYEKAAHYAEREKPFAAAHLAHVLAAVERGELVLGGPLGDPIDGTNVVLFNIDSVSTVEAFAAADPYVQHGVVSRWWVRAWETVVGEKACHPLRDERNQKP
jgi:uncharacterized protein YciI